jgi:hypothetical protein
VLPAETSEVPGGGDGFFSGAVFSPAKGGDRGAAFVSAQASSSLPVAEVWSCLVLSSELFPCIQIVFLYCSGLEIAASVLRGQGTLHTVHCCLLIDYIIFAFKCNVPWDSF